MTERRRISRQRPDSHNKLTPGPHHVTSHHRSYGARGHSRTPPSPPAPPPACHDDALWTAHLAHSLHWNSRASPDAHSVTLAHALAHAWLTCPHKPRAQHNLTAQVATVARSRHQMKHSPVRPPFRARAVVALAALTSPPLMLNVGRPLRRAASASGSAGASSLTRA